MDILEIAKKAYKAGKDPYKDPNTGITYWALEQPRLIIAEEPFDAWGDPVTSTIMFKAYVRGNLFSETNIFCDLDDMEIFVRTYDICLKVDNEEVERLKNSIGFLGCELNGREAVELSEQLLSFQAFEKFVEEYGRTRRPTLSED